MRSNIRQGINMALLSGQEFLGVHSLAHVRLGFVPLTKQASQVVIPSRPRRVLRGVH
jgi:hypothetical protein